MSEIYQNMSADIAEKVVEQIPEPTPGESSANPTVPVQALGDIPTGLESFYKTLISQLPPTNMEGRDIKVDSSDSMYRSAVRKRMIFSYSPQTFLDLEPAPGSLLAVILDERRKFMANPRKVMNWINPYNRDGAGIRQTFENTETLIQPKKFFQTNIEREIEIEAKAERQAEKFGRRNNIQAKLNDVNTKPKKRTDYVPGQRGTALSTIDRPISNAQAAASNHGSLVSNLGRFLKGIKKPGAVKFSPFRFSVYKRQSLADQELNEAAGGIKDKELPRGTYLFTFDVPHVGGLPPFAVTEPIPFKWNGKQMIVEKAVINPATGEVRMQVEVVENFILMMGLVIGALSAAGFAGYGLEKSLKQVDRVVLQLGTQAKTLTIAAVVGVGLWISAPLLKRKAAAL